MTISKSCASSINLLFIPRVQLKKGAEFLKETFLLYTLSSFPGFVTVILLVTTI